MSTRGQATATLSIDNDDSLPIFKMPAYPIIKYVFDSLLICFASSRTAYLPRGLGLVAPPAGEGGVVPERQAGPKGLPRRRRKRVQCWRPSREREAQVPQVEEISVPPRS